MNLTRWIVPHGQLAQLFFRSELDLNTREVVRWWERRRLAYNVAVGGAGTVSISYLVLVSLIGPGGRFIGGPPAMLLVGYAVVANIAFSLGPLTELALRRSMGWRSGVVGAALFRYGLAFATGLTLLPIPIATLELAGRLAGWLWGRAG